MLVLGVQYGSFIETINTNWQPVIFSFVVFIDKAFETCIMFLKGSLTPLLIYKSSISFFSPLWHLQAERGVHSLHTESLGLGTRLARSLGKLFWKEEKKEIT